ncbi:MAG: PAS domain S-box protein [Candidatus Omnitrophica bacterium]|nr:PAS domain S-box protein [Candidatus Omnitrophota bacterium]
MESRCSIVQEYRIRAKGGEEKWVSDHKTAISAEGGRVNYVDGIAYDITDHKKKVRQLEIFHKAAVGRELKMKELEEEIERLRARAGGKNGV